MCFHYKKIIFFLTQAVNFTVDFSLTLSLSIFFLRHPVSLFAFFLSLLIFNIPNRRRNPVCNSCCFVSVTTDSDTPNRDETSCGESYRIASVATHSDTYGRDEVVSLAVLRVRFATVQFGLWLLQPTFCLAQLYVQFACNSAPRFASSVQFVFFHRTIGL